MILNVRLISNFIPNHLNFSRSLIRHLSFLHSITHYYSLSYSPNSSMVYSLKNSSSSALWYLGWPYKMARFIASAEDFASNFQDSVS